VGCLYVDDSLFDRHARDGSTLVSGIPGVRVYPFQYANVRDLWDRLQDALFDLRVEWGAAAAIAVGTGCAPVLALACQLPVEKLVLIDPIAPARASRLVRGKGSETADDGRRFRALRRFTAFARRNLPLCVSDMLIVGHGDESGVDAMRRAYGDPVNCRVNRLDALGRSDKDLYIIREFAVKEAISRFLHPTDSSKPLAENPEMCIIYG
jgi:hypothetical protein